jgi:hypothetical protein
MNKNAKILGILLLSFLYQPLVMADWTCVIYRDLDRQEEQMFAGWSYSEANAKDEAFDRCTNQLTASVCRGSSFYTKCSGDEANVSDWTCVVYKNLYRESEEFYAGWSGSKTMAFENAIGRCAKQYDGSTCRGSQFSSHCSGRY